MREVQQIFRRKQILVIGLCSVIFFLSQFDFKVSTVLKEFASKEETLSVAQVVHLTTAIFLVLIGSLLEYTPRADLYIVVIGVTVSVAKVANGMLFLRGEQFIKKMVDDDIYRYFPVELFFAISDSIKYI